MNQVVKTPMRADRTPNKAVSCDVLIIGGGPAGSTARLCSPNAART